MAATTNIYGFNVGGNNNSFDQRGHFYRGVFSGNVTGMLVKQNSTPNMTVLVEHGSALLNKNTISASVAEIKSDTSVTIDTANTSNPRIDTVVIYEDTSVAIPSVEANYWQDGAGGRFKIVSLPGTAGASPVALSDANIQTAIGAGKPWTRLADITVPTNSTTILNSNIADKRKIVSPNVSNYGANGLLSADSNGAVSVNTAPTGTNWPAVNVNTNNTNVNSDTYYTQYTYTVPANASGRYFMSFSQQMTNGNAGSDFTTSITVNGTEVVSTANGGTNYVNYIVPTSIWAGPLNAGDTIICRSKGGGTGVFSTRYGRFTIMRII